MLLCVQTADILDPLGVEEGFRLIAEAGFDGVDFNIDHCLPGGQIRAGDCSGFFDQTDEEILAACEPYKRAAERYGVRFLQAHAAFPTLVPDPDVTEYVLRANRKMLMMCGYVGCRYLVVHPGCLPTDVRLTPEQEWDFNIRMYTSLIPDLKKHGVICCLENMFSRHRGKVMEAICSNPFEANRYVDALNEIAGERLFAFCLDVGHATLLGRDIYTLIHQLGDRIQLLHVHDNNGLEDEHLFPYMGITDWDGFCRGLKEIGYSNHLSFETFNALATFDRALTPQLLSLLHATGKLFAHRITGED